MSTHETWTIKAALDWTSGYLAHKGDKSPRPSAEWLISEATNLSRIELYTNFDRPLSIEERDVLREYVSRRGQGEPLQYITGEVGFRHIVVRVRPGVLIPRPETEVLVSEALALLPVAPRPRAREEEENASFTVPSASELLGEKQMSNLDFSELSSIAVQELQGAIDEAFSPSQETYLVADICTGSGCIACSIAHEHPCTRVIATDISPEAVLLARDNVHVLGLEDQVEIIEGDLGQRIDNSLIGEFDLVVSNPPYIPTAVLEELEHEVAGFEPELALDGGQDGLDIARRLFVWCKTALKPGGGFVFELHETCLDAAAALAREAGFLSVRIVNDLANRPRILIARKP